MDKSEARTILGVGANASQEEIKQSYRILIKSYHPDKNPHLTNAEKRTFSQKYQRIQEAYETLRTIKQSNQQKNQDTYYKSRGETYDEFKERKSKERQEQQERAKRDREEQNRQDRESKEKQDRESKEKQDRERKKREEKDRRDRERKKREEAIRILKEEKIRKRKTQMQTVLFVIAILSIIIITNPFNFGNNQMDVNNPEPDAIVPDPEPVPVIEPDCPAGEERNADGQCMQICPNNQKRGIDNICRETITLSSFGDRMILLGNNGENAGIDKPCNNFENLSSYKKSENDPGYETKPSTLYFGKLHGMRCAKSIIIFDLNPIIQKLDSMNIDSITLNYISLNTVGTGNHGCGELELPGRGQGGGSGGYICHKPEDAEMKPELKYHLSNNPNCSTSDDELFTKQEDWKIVTTWKFETPQERSNTSTDILQIEVRSTSERYLCLSLSQDGTDQTGDNNPNADHYRLWAIEDVKIEFTFVEK